ncbi:Cytochrome P450 monooxygenase aflV [Colletotrichum trifolii]|uniref:Cytochrome P450 monooxygenase aflV n=1 Tax=Colletotrichum trifolii TaxID=5466 RepID=A0A4R8R6A2_COLTR|nr:Cytochrome P450 monooxygenase aflV [Colletotrichum trifolii]
MGVNLAYVATVALAAFLLQKFILHPLFNSPLAKIPVPHWSCHIAPIWILLARKHNYQNQRLHQAHQALGSVIRVGPNELSVDGFDALKTVYQGGFEKDKWYSIFENYGVPCMFSTLDSKAHSLRKRMISNVYSKSFMQASPAAKAQCKAILFERLLPLLCESAAALEPHGIDVFSTFLASAMDFITAYVFGLSNSTDFLRQKAYQDHWLQLYLVRSSYGFWPQEMPRFTKFCGRLGSWAKPYPAWVDDANGELGDWNKRLCDKARNAIHGKKPMEEEWTANEPVVFRALEAGIEKERRVNGHGSLLYSTIILQRDLSMASEVMDQVLAGQETAGIALTYMAWHLSKSPELQAELRRELLILDPPLTISAVPSSPNGFPEAKQVDGLPVLHAIIMETLRLHAPIPGPEPRRTPHPSCQLGPYQVPGGARVSAVGWALHRNEKVFPKSDVWDYTRWLESETSEEQRKEMKRYFWAFGSGGRMCVGSNFAMNGKLILSAGLLESFRSYIAVQR